MNAMLSIVAGNVKHQARRFLGPALGVLLGTLFVTTSLILGASLQGSIYSSLSGDYGAYAAVVTPEGEAGTLPDSALERVRRAPGVKRAYGVAQAAARAAARWSPDDGRRSPVAGRPSGPYLPPWLRCDPRRVPLPATAPAGSVWSSAHSRWCSE